MSALTYGPGVQWRFRSLQSGFVKVGRLELYWEVANDFVTDDYAATDPASDIWPVWVASIRQNESYHPGLGDPYVPITWQIRGSDSGTSESAPYAEDVYPVPGSPRPDFLTYYTPPVDEVSGEPISWLRLPVVDKLWRPGQTSKGGFITELSGWSPAPLQSAVDLRVFEAAGLRIY